MEQEEELELVKQIRIMYLLEKKSFPKIGKELGMTVGKLSYLFKKYGIPTRGYKEGWKTRFPDGRFGAIASNWKGGRRPIGKYLYIYKPDHPHATTNGCVMEHRLVMEEKLGRILKPGEIVHHINGDGRDNRPENLEVQDRSTHVHNHFAHGRDVMKLEEEIRTVKEENKKLAIDLEERIRALEEIIKRLKVVRP